MLPSCTQCALTGRRCAGYQQAFIFLQQQHTARKRAHQQRVGKFEKTSTSPTVAPPKLLDGNHLKECTDFIIVQYAPWLVEDFKTSSSTFRICGSWVALLPKLLENRVHDGLLPSAVIALSLSIQCKENPDNGPRTECVKVYCTALSLLRKHLLNLATRSGTELVAASMCLTLSEVCYI